MNQKSITTAKKVFATTRDLLKTDPRDESVQQIVAALKEQVTQLASEADGPSEPSQVAKSSNDIEFLRGQISKMQQAAEIPSKNYTRIVEIFKGLSRAAQICERPQYASLRPRIAAIVEKVAGIFSEVDTVQDLDKPLEAIEKAVHGLYGDQSKNSTYMFERRNKPYSGKRHL